MKLCRAIQNKHRGKLSAGIVLSYNNARPHTADLNVCLLNLFNWKCLSKIFPGRFKKLYQALEILQIFFKTIFY